MCKKGAYIHAQTPSPQEVLKSIVGVCLNHYQVQQSVCSWISPHSLVPPCYFLRFLYPSTSSKPWMLSLQPDCSNKSSLSPMPCLLSISLFSQNPAAVHGGRSLNENHILGLMRVMGCEVGVCFGVFVASVYVVHCMHCLHGI